MTARKAFGAALIGAGLCSVVGAAYVAWGTAGALFVGGFGLYVAGYTIYVNDGRRAAIAAIESRKDELRERARNPYLN